MHVGQAEVAAGVAVGERFVVEAQQVEDGGVQVVDVDRLLDGFEAEFVGGAVGRGRPSRRRRPASMVKPQWLWSRPLILPALAPACGSSTVGVRPNSPPQMTSVSSNRPRRLRSVRAPRSAWSHCPASLRWFDCDVVVVVPGLALAVPDLHEADAALDAAGGRSGFAGPACRCRRLPACASARG